MLTNQIYSARRPSDKIRFDMVCLENASTTAKCFCSKDLGKSLTGELNIGTFVFILCVALPFYFYFLFLHS